MENQKSTSPPQRRKPQSVLRVSTNGCESPHKTEHSPKQVIVQLTVLPAERRTFTVFVGVKPG